MRTERNGQLNRALWMYTLLLVAISTAGWLVVAVATQHGQPYPQNSLLFSPIARFSDWTNFSVRVAHHGEPDVLTRRDISPLPYPYPLASFYLYLVFVRAFHDSLRAYLVASILIFLTVGLLYFISVRKKFPFASLTAAIAATVLLAEPMYFLIDRGNIEIFLWLFVVGGTVAFARNRAWIATVLFAIAAAMKIYPFLYLLLFIRRRQWKFLIAGTVLTAALSVGAMYEIGPTIQSAMQETTRSGQFLRDEQIVPLNVEGTRFDHSLLGMGKAVHFQIRLRQHRTSLAMPPSYPKAVLVYSIAGPLLFVLLYLGFVARLPLLNQFQAFTLLSLLLPYVSYEYTLIHVCTMAGVFVFYLATDYRSGRSALSFRAVGFVLAGFAIVLAPLSFGPLQVAPGLPKGLILVAMLVFTLTTPMPSSLFSDLSETAAGWSATQVTGRKPGASKLQRG